MARAVPKFHCSRKQRTRKFTSKLNVRGCVVLSEILKSLNLPLVEDCSASDSVCKKCATMLNELESLIIKINKEEAVKAATRSKRALVQSSPSGFTPGKKKIAQNVSGMSLIPKPRKSLFNLNNSWSNKENMEDAISNLMSLPVEKTEDNKCIVKVRKRRLYENYLTFFPLYIYYKISFIFTFISLQIFIAYSSGRVIEHECKDINEELFVKNIALKNYKAAAAGVTKLAPLMKETTVQIAKELKKELRNYSRDPNAVFRYENYLF